MANLWQRNSIPNKTHPLIFALVAFHWHFKPSKKISIHGLVKKKHVNSIDDETFQIWLPSGNDCYIAIEIAQSKYLMFPWIAWWFSSSQTVTVYLECPMKNGDFPLYFSYVFQRLPHFFCFPISLQGVPADGLESSAGVAYDFNGILWWFNGI